MPPRAPYYTTNINNNNNISTLSTYSVAPWPVPFSNSSSGGSGGGGGSGLRVVEQIKRGGGVGEVEEGGDGETTPITCSEGSAPGDGGCRADATVTMATPCDPQDEDATTTPNPEHKLLEKIYTVLARMERNEVILTVVLSTLAALVSMGLTFLLCYWCSRRKHKRRSDELGSLQFMLPTDGSGKEGGRDLSRGSSLEQQQQQQGASKGSTLRLKTPFIKTKPVNAQLEYENSSNNPEQANGQAKAQPGSAKDVVGAMRFWQNRSLSQLDMFIDQSEPTENCGQIQFSLEYDFQSSTLVLKIMQAKDLPAKDLSGTSDPYVRVTLLPDKKHRLETKIKRRTLHPRWNETFYFEGFPIQKLQSRVLHLHVFDYDRFSRDDSIGEVHVPLCQVDLSEKPVFWKALKPLLKDKCGELLVSLCYHPTNSQLTITVVKARNLKAKDITGKSDPYVKVWLQHGDKRVEKKKTCIIKRTLNPVYNESFVFSVPWEKLRETSLLVSVMDFDSVGRNELIGKINMSSKGGVTESKHWNGMISKPRQAVMQWHRLKPE